MYDLLEREHIGREGHTSLFYFSDFLSPCYNEVQPNQE